MGFDARGGASWCHLAEAFVNRPDGIMNRIVNYPPLLEHVFRTDTKRMPLPLPSGLRKQWRSHAKNPVKQLPWIPSFFFSFFLFLDQIVVVEFSGRRSSSRIDP